ncbi:early nodulin-like protein 4 [Gastrolobium bilobum]|uniref:early nodulin-like protein 4 n=1 Tax=Gastrolobium bilobum TaxID=150636 RepID=UPI002AAFE2B6|nr:early nodulin-like protein 4 [Gastrolobium bilobum]
MGFPMMADGPDEWLDTGDVGASRGCGHISDRFLGFMFFMIPLLLLSLSFSLHAVATEFQVGGEDGWVVKPSEEYNHWARRQMFHVNDILYFEYKKGNDSVLVVKEEDYYSCNITNPIHKIDDGNSTFRLHKPSIFFFISGNVSNCENGQKLIIAVMSASPAPSPSKVSDSARLLQG